METTGQVTRVTTTKDNFIRLTVDIPAETCPNEILAQVNQNVRLYFKEDGK